MHNVSVCKGQGHFGFLDTEWSIVCLLNLHKHQNNGPEAGGYLLLVFGHLSKRFTIWWVSSDSEEGCLEALKMEKKKDEAVNPTARDEYTTWPQCWCWSGLKKVRMYIVQAKSGAGAWQACVYNASYHPSSFLPALHVWHFLFAIYMYLLNYTSQPSCPGQCGWEVWRGETAARHSETAAGTLKWSSSRRRPSGSSEEDDRHERGQPSQQVVGYGECLISYSTANKRSNIFWHRPLVYQTSSPHRAVRICRMHWSAVSTWWEVLQYTGAS